MPLLFFLCLFAEPKAIGRQNRVAFDFLSIFFQSAFFKKYAENPNKKIFLQLFLKNIAF